MKIRWQAPPEPRVRGRKPDTRTEEQKFADQLRKRPGQWAILTDDASTAKAWQIGAGQVRAFRPTDDGTYQAVARTLDTSKPGRGRIYVRFVPAGD